MHFLGGALCPGCLKADGPPWPRVRGEHLCR